MSAPCTRPDLGMNTMMPVSPRPDTGRGDRLNFGRVDQSVSENEWTVFVTLIRSRWNRRRGHPGVSQACQFSVGIERHVFVDPIIYARAQDNFEWSCTVCTSVRAIGGQEFSTDILIHSQSGYGTLRSADHYRGLRCPPGFQPYRQVPT